MTMINDMNIDLFTANVSTILYRLINNRRLSFKK